MKKDRRKIGRRREEKESKNKDEKEKYRKEFAGKPLKSVFNDKKVFRRYLFRKYNIIGCKF